jgi:hypothetical protein
MLVVDFWSLIFDSSCAVGGEMRWVVVNVWLPEAQIKDQ